MPAAHQHQASTSYITMQTTSNRQSFRGVQRSPHPGTAAYMQGKKQAALSIQRYHILCAALQGKCVVRDIEPIGPIADSDTKSDEDSELAPLGHPFQKPPHLVRCTIDFSAYKEFKLRPIKDVELPQPDRDDCANFSDLIMYERMNDDDWRMREGGVLYALAEYGNFFNCIYHYHTHQRTFIKGWTDLFERLQSSGYCKNIIPCMFFGQRDGCLDRNCPFLHDRAAVLADRNRVLEKRREKFHHKQRPNYHQSLLHSASVLCCIAGNNDALQAEIQKSGQWRKNFEDDRAYCTNRQCMKPWKRGDNKNPLKACTGCKYTLYCSPKCQKEDWPRHKQEPCAPMEEMVENDDIWYPLGFRKGTTLCRTHKDYRMRRFDDKA